MQPSKATVPHHNKQSTVTPDDTCDICLIEFNELPLDELGSDGPALLETMFLKQREAISGDNRQLIF